MNRKLWTTVIGILFTGLLLAGCGPAAKELTPEAQNWLVTADELGSFSDMVGISGWEVVEESPGKYRVCRTFSGASWSVNPNFASNCIKQVDPDITFEEVIDLMYELEVLVTTDVVLEPRFSYDRDYVLYAYVADTG